MAENQPGGEVEQGAGGECGREEEGSGFGRGGSFSIASEMVQICSNITLYSLSVALTIITHGMYLWFHHLMWL